MNSNSIQPLASIHLVAELHKEAQQATGGPTSLGVTSEEGANPQLNSKHDVLAKFNKTKKESKADKDVSFGYDVFHTSHDLFSSDDTKKEIKLEDLSKLVQDVGTNFMDIDSPEDDKPIIVQDDSDEEVHDEKNHKLEQQNNKAEAEVAFFTTQPSYPNVTQLAKLLVTSLKPELSHLLSSHDFGSSLPTELKELSSNFNELTREVKELKTHVHDLKIELPGDLKEIPTKLKTFTLTIKSLNTQVAELKTLQWELLAEFQSVPTQFAQVFESTSKKARDNGVPLAGLAGTHPSEGEKNTQQIIISQLFQRKAAKDAKKANLNKPIPTTTPETSTIPPIITTTTTQLQSPFLLIPPKSSSQLEGELTKKDKGKVAMSSKDAKEESAKSNSDDDTINLAGSIVESSKKKKMKKFDFVTKGGEHVHFTKEQIKEHKRIGESVKADAAKQEVEERKEE
ncbi:hypothetical protein Tco_0618608 [Tanacetum coccineum]